MMLSMTQAVLDRLRVNLLPILFQAI